MLWYHWDGFYSIKLLWKSLVLHLRHNYSISSCLIICGFKGLLRIHQILIWTVQLCKYWFILRWWSRLKYAGIDSSSRSRYLGRRPSFSSMVQKDHQRVLFDNYLICHKCFLHCCKIFRYSAFTCLLSHLFLHRVPSDEEPSLKD